MNKWKGSDWTGWDLKKDQKRWRDLLLCNYARKYFCKRQRRINDETSIKLKLRNNANKYIIVTFFEN